MQNFRCRLLPLHTLTGVQNMAADEALLQAASRGEAALRFYQWSVPTLSLGYFQQAADRHADANLTSLSWVRRASGGAAILHHHELTYCLALPTGTPWQSKENGICRFHRLIAASLQERGVFARPVACGEEKKLGEFLCFLHQTPGDLLVEKSKVAGSAQRKMRGAILQHGSILLHRSPHTPQLPGINDLAGKSIGVEELAERLVEAFAREMNCEFVRRDFDQDEKLQMEQIVSEKYGATGWNEKR